MDSFDLGRLSDYDFEVVCRDLFEEALGLKLEILARGADGGIDLRHVAGDGGSVVIQCKHWIRSGRARLLAHMRGKERAKIVELRPARYILATSVELTAAAKDTLLQDLAPYVHNTGDLYGAEQLNEELRKRPALVQRHLRLWLSSTAVLQAVLNQDALIRSEDLLSELDDAAKTFVPTPAFDVARELLERESVCLLAGIPGIGKSTIAKMLARLQLEKGYQLVDVTREISEIDKLWLPETPQLFLYDDFLGEIAPNHYLGKNEDRRLLRVLRRIRKTPGKLLVLTTREYILREAKHRHEILDDGDLEPLTCDVELNAYSMGIRANILYNHVYYSEISAAEKRKFAVSSLWHELLWHRNFSPRLVENTLRFAGRDGTEEAAGCCSATAGQRGKGLTAQARWCPARRGGRAKSHRVPRGARLPDLRGAGFVEVAVAPVFEGAVPLRAVEALGARGTALTTALMNVCWRGRAAAAVTCRRLRSAPG